MKKIILITILIWSGMYFSAADTNTFAKTLGGTNNDVARCIQQTKDGGYIIAGYTNSYGAGNYDVYLVKTDAHGNELWSKTFGGKDNDFGKFVIQAGDGGYIVTGSTKSIAPEGFATEGTYAYLIKTDAKGNEIWSRSFGQGTYDSGECVSQLPGGGYLVTGGTGSYSTSVECMLIETDAEGDLFEYEWSSGNASGLSMSLSAPGGEGFDFAYNAQRTTDGNYIIVGETDSFGAGNSDVYLVKMKTGFPDNEQLWDKTIGGADYDIGHAIRQTSDGGYIIVGDTGIIVDKKDFFDICLIKTDAQGNKLWSKTFGGEQNETGYDVEQTPDGGYIIAGRTYSFGAGKSDVYLIKTDARGNEIWSKTFGGKGYEGAHSIRKTADGGFIIAGYYSSNESVTDDIYIIKLDSRGNMDME